MVVFYKKINDLMQLDNTPSPTLEFAFQYLGSATYYSLLYLNSAYNQTPLTERSKPFTSFVTPYGQLEYKQVPFGIATGSLVLTQLINKIFGEVMYKHVFSYFEDICIYTTGTFEEHLVHLEDAITLLQRAGLTINLEKMSLASNTMHFLGHAFSNRSISIDNEKVWPIQEFPIPKNVKQVQRFIGAFILPSMQNLSKTLCTFRNH